MIIAGLLNAAYSREELRQKRRRQFHIYADEFQNFATEDFATLIDESRGFGIGCNLAHQNLGQLSDRVRASVLGTGNKVVYRVSGEDANDLIDEFDVKPPPVEQVEIGKKPILTLKQDIIGELLTTGHRNEAVRKFITKYLSRLHQVSSQKDSKTWTEYGSSHDELAILNSTQATEYPTVTWSNDKVSIECDYTPSKIKLSLSNLNKFMFEIVKEGYEDPFLDSDLQMSAHDLYEFGGRLGFTQESIDHKISDGRLLTTSNTLDFSDLKELGKASHYKKYDYKELAEKILRRALREKLKLWYPSYPLFEQSVIAWANTILGEDGAESMAATEDKSIEYRIFSNLTELFQEAKFTSFGFSLALIWVGVRNGLLNELPEETLLIKMVREFQKIIHTIPGILLVIENCYKFLESFWDCMEELMRDPIMTESGSYEPVYRDISVRTYADVKNEYALKISNLPNFHAIVKLAETPGMRFITTIEPEAPDKRYREPNRQAIIENCLAKGYLRKREDIEEEIARRQQTPPPTVRKHAV
jgi:hypothetical protein